MSTEIFVVSKSPKPWFQSVAFKNISEFVGGDNFIGPPAGVIINCHSIFLSLKQCWAKLKPCYFENFVISEGCRVEFTIWC